MPFIPATRQRVRMRTEIHGPSGSGKTATALLIATALARRYGGKIAVIDTQGGQSLDYVDTPFAPDGFEIDIVEDKPTIARLQGAFSAAVAAGRYSVVVIDSFSSPWAGEGGVLSQSSGIDDRDRFQAWDRLKEPLKKFIGTMQKSPVHVICTLRVKTEYVFTKEDDGKGREKTGIHRVGLRPVQDKDISYEFSLQLRMDEYNVMTVERTSCSEFNRLQIQNPNMDTFVPFMEWMDKGRTDTGFDRIVSRKASQEQLREYYLLHERVNKLPEEKVALGFVKNYGIKPEEASEDLIEERLELIRAEWERKKPKPRPALATTASKTAVVADKVPTPTGAVADKTEDTK